MPLLAQEAGSSRRSFTNWSGRPKMMESSAMVNLTPTRCTCVDLRPFLSETLKPSAPIFARIKASMELRSLSVPCNTHSPSSKYTWCCASPKHRLQKSC